MSFRHVFFDLDRTLWDFDRNSKETLLELFDSFDLKERTELNDEEFVTQYQLLNEALWAKYRKGSIQKEELRSSRFRIAFLNAGIEDTTLADRFGERYLEICPLKTGMVPGAMEVLETLDGKYALHIITNGFEETQAIKMRAANIHGFFDEVITSEAANARKPDPAIFELALARANSALKDAIIIGDDHEADILGGKNFGMAQIHYAPTGEENGATYTVRKMVEVLDIL